MRGSRFWATNWAGPPQRESVDGAFAATLSEMDRCDRCGARAYVRVVLPSGRDLLFCAHHNRMYASVLTKVAVEIRDETHQLVRVGA